MNTKFIVLLFLIVILGGCKKTPGPNEVFMDDTKFNPSTIRIKPGTTVTWINQENKTHTVTSDNGLFESGSMGKKDEFTYTFNTVGTFTYYCIPHSGMRGVVIVQ